MAKFKNLRYRDGFLTIGNTDLRVSKSDLTCFIQGIAQFTKWSNGLSNICLPENLILSLGDYKLYGSVVSEKIQVYILNSKNAVIDKPVISSNMDSFKDKKPVEVGTLVFRIIQYLSQFV